MTLSIRCVDMSFKDTIKADIKRVFINFDEFGEKHIVEGKEIVIVVDTDELIERQGGQELAIAESGTLFYAQCSDLPPRRAPGSNLNVDGRECLVDEWREDMGIAAIALRENITA